MPYRSHRTSSNSIHHFGHAPRLCPFLAAGPSFPLLPTYWLTKLGGDPREDGRTHRRDDLTCTFHLAHLYSAKAWLKLCRWRSEVTSSLTQTV